MSSAAKSEEMSIENAIEFDWNEVEEQINVTDVSKDEGMIVDQQNANQPVGWPAEEASSPSQVKINRNQCPMCLAQFALEKNYVEHMWAAHGNKRPFRCDDCGLYLSYRSSLYNHRKIHSDKRPFSCTECSSRFRWNNSLKYHMKRAHNKEVPWVASSRRLVQVEKQKASKSKSKSPPIPTVPISSLQSVPDASRIESGRGKRLLQVSWLEPKFCLKCNKKFFLESAFEAHQEACTKKSVLETIRTIQQQEKERKQLLDEARKLSSAEVSSRNSRKSVAASINGQDVQHVNGTIENALLAVSPHQVSPESAAAVPDESLDLRTNQLPPSGTLDARLSQIYQRQESLLRRLEGFESWVQQRVTKMELILGALAARHNDNA